MAKVPPKRTKNPRPSPGQPSELDFIASLARRISTASHPAIRLGIGDDCAILSPENAQEIAITTDFSLENRHFRRNFHPPESVGHRALARGLSDLAAMGATPLAAFLSLALPPDALKPVKRDDPNSSWSARFLTGLLALASQHKVPLAGGDTAESPNGLILADIVLVGTLPSRRALLRSGASVGDAIYVTGSLGGSAAELADLLRHPKRFAALTVDNPAHPHLYPQPRIAVGQSLLRHNLATSTIDLSDGLSTDLAHLCQASRVAATIHAAALPIAPNASLDHALNGGEDYELLFTAPAATRLPKSIAGVPITRIGTLLAPKKRQPQCTLITADGKSIPLPPSGHEHFVTGYEHFK